MRGLNVFLWTYLKSGESLTHSSKSSSESMLSDAFTATKVHQSLFMLTVSLLARSVPALPSSWFTLAPSFVSNSGVHDAGKLSRTFLHGQNR